MSSDGGGAATAAAPAPQKISLTVCVVPLRRGEASSEGPIQHCVEITSSRSDDGRSYIDPRTVIQEAVQKSAKAGELREDEVSFRFQSAENCNEISKLGIYRCIHGT